MRARAPSLAPARRACARSAHANARARPLLPAVSRMRAQRDCDCAQRSRSRHTPFLRPGASRVLTQPACGRARHECTRHVCARAVASP
eukprot:3227773-Pleurochrysis_carterae.AAC.1